MTDAGNESNLANESLANVIGMRNESPNFENIENSMSTDKKLNAFQPEENNCTSNGMTCWPLQIIVRFCTKPSHVAKGNIVK